MYEYVTQLPTKIYGLKYEPTLEPKQSNSSDYISLTRDVHPGDGNGQFTTRNGEIIYSVLDKRKNVKLIVEIGVARKYDNSSTYLLSTMKPGDCQYIGIDVDFAQKMENQNKNPNCLYLQTDSRNMDALKDKMKELNLKEIDILMIDGDHSVDCVVNDWKYAELLSKDGVVIFHDTNEHPGPYVVFDAVDEKIFDKEKFFTDRNDDWGIAVCYKK